MPFDAGELRLVLTRLMRPTANMQIHGFLTAAFDIVHRTRQCSGILALRRVPLFVLRLPLLRIRPTLFLYETLEQLYFSALLFYPLLPDLLTKDLRVSSPELFLS